MPTYRCTGRDVHLGHVREWWVIAESGAEAKEFSRGRGLSVEALGEADANLRPAAALLLRVPAPMTQSGTDDPRGMVRRRIRLMLIGVGVALFLIAMFLFARRASEHLGRGRPPIERLPE